jgi:cysteinyl-tRNA synthetase
MALAPRAAGELGYPQLDAAERELASLYAARKRLLELPPERIVPVQTPPSDALSCFPDALSQALEHDLDTPRALAALASFLVAVNTLCDGVMRKQGRANASLLESARAGVSTALGSLGVGAEDPSAFLTRVRDRRAQRAQLDVAAIDAVVAERSAARSARDFATADRLQAQLLAQGVQLLDAPSGTSWTLH